MLPWIKRLIVAACAPLLLTGCLWGPGKFQSDLIIRKDNSFVLDYRGEMIIQTPPDDAKLPPWDPKEMIRCHRSGKIENWPDVGGISEEDDAVRPCTAAEIAKGKADYEKKAAEKAAAKRKESEEMAKMFGLPGLDDASNRAFAAKLMKYAGWRSVTYRGKGVFDVDYHFEGRATQDFLFPALPDNDFIIPFIAIRRRADGSILVTAPAMTGGAGPLAARAGGAAASPDKGPVSRAQGRFTIVTDGQVLTNNSEDGPKQHVVGRSVHWDVTPTANKVPEALIKLQ
ncbi:MAG TPA: hypothetical protein VJM15_10705 [Sphingomicrobium sp.]|nr:hypothetical protein [Sphingomicrobium sp.]